MHRNAADRTLLTDMEEHVKNRLVGAAVLSTLVVIFVPMILDEGDEGGKDELTSTIPPLPEVRFHSRIVPLGGREATVQPASQKAEPDSNPRLSDTNGATHPEEPVKSAPEAAPVAPKSAVKIPSPPEEPATETARPGVVALSGWVVQLGSFSQSENAVALRDRLRKEGFTAFVETVHLKGKTSTRVYVGPELLRENATKSRDGLEKRLKMKGIVVRYPGS